MDKLEVYTQDIFHLCLKHKNTLLKIYGLGEVVDTKKNLKIKRCAIYLKKKFSQRLLDDLNQLRLYPLQNDLIHSVDHLQIKIERIGYEKVHIKQMPFKFEYVLNSNSNKNDQNQDSSFS